MKVVSLVGARPQFIKEAVVNSIVREKDAWQHILVHSGQHYDFNMSGAFFEEFGIPKPDYYLSVGSGGHAMQTADTLVKFEKVLLKENPDLVMLYGDTNTTLAGALDAAKLHIPVAHVEAGPRVNRLFPEEINRVLTDHVSDYLFACTELNVQNLAKEGITKNVYNTGDVMYDLYLRMQKKMTPDAEIRNRFGFEREGYVLVTIHRDLNTDNKSRFEAILKGLNRISKTVGLKILYPIHPRARKMVEQFGFGDLLKELTVTEPLGYLELMSLLQSAKFVVTDSGGFQREAYWAGKRGMLLLPQGWSEITDTGWHLLENEPESVNWEERALTMMCKMEYPMNIFGDGHAAEKIVEIIKDCF